MQIKSEKNKKEWSQHKADSMIALVAVAWGSSYLLMKIGLGSVPPFSIIALRFGIAFFFVAFLFFQKLKLTSKHTLLYGSLLGFILFSVFAFLMHGLETTTASNAGFLTSTTVVLVPIFHSLISRKLPEHSIIFGTVLTMVGIGFLTLQQSFVLHSGDFLCLCGAADYACHILLTGRLAQRIGQVISIYISSLICFHL